MQNALNNDLKQDATTSKTKIKQEMHALQKIGERLVELSPQQLAEFFLPDTLMGAIIEAKQIRKHGARRRQIQFIGKLMREVDVGQIQKKLSAWDGTSKQHIAWIHLIERWRNCLLKDNYAFAEFAQEYPAADLQRIRTLVRNVHKEMSTNKPPKSFRALFHELQINIPETSEQNDVVIK
ncbi:MAG: DUF615 domain-containing protein [Nitrosomonadales bacterium]|nr:MAG: DUF615 domain-containing protein [Nitrosomonadales bacterium]